MQELEPGFAVQATQGCAVWTAVWVLGAGEKADDGFVSHSGACEGVGGCTGWFDWPVPWVVALALDHYHY